MAEGTVRWFNSERGYGYIVPDGGTKEVYVHYSEIQTNGYKTLDEGERVSFDVTYGPNGLRAVTVTPLGEWRSPPPAPSSDSAAPPGRPDGAAGAGRPAGSGGPAGGSGPARGGAVRGVLLGVLALLMLAGGVAFVVVGMIQGEEIGAVFLLLTLAIGGLVAWIERD